MVYQELEDMLAADGADAEAEKPVTGYLEFSFPADGDEIAVSIQTL